MGIFGTPSDLPPGCSHADIERAFGEPDISPESEKVYELLDETMVDTAIIHKVVEIVENLADRANNCPVCMKRRDDAEYELEMELRQAGDEYNKREE